MVGTVVRDGAAVRLAMGDKRAEPEGGGTIRTTWWRQGQRSNRAAVGDRG
jgi:hypothetical protein